MFDVIKEILISEKSLLKLIIKDYKKLRFTLDSNGGMYLTVDSLIETNNIITGANKITLKIYMDLMKCI